jgi:hypothetical protein
MSCRLSGVVEAVLAPHLLQGSAVEGTVKANERRSISRIRKARAAGITGSEKPAKSRPMTPEEMVHFEKKVVRREDERRLPPKTLIPM